MNKNNDDSKVLYHILGLKASHITGIIISSYITIIFLNLGIKEQTISLLVASIGVTYPIISMICGISSDRIGRFKVYLIGKIVSIVFIFLAFFFVKEKILALCLYVVEAVENGIEPLIYAVATDNSNEKTRMKIFTWLSLGGSIGMMLISLITAYLMDFNMQVYIVILLLLELISLYFMYKSERNVRVVAKNKEGSLALILFNIDDFKLYNQLYGNQQGDVALRKVADIIQASVGEQGYVARHSAKEFAVLMPNYDIFSARNLAESIQKQILHMRNDSADYKLKILTVSVGISAAPYAARSAKELLDNADLAVYHVKRSGKNGIEIFDTMLKESLDEENAGKKSDHEHIYQSYESTIYALTAAIDTKDHYTFGHSNNVAYYATSLAKALNYTTEMVEIIRQAALLHDVGKIGIPEHILNKEGKLTDEEYEIMKGHVEASIGIIRHLPSLDYVIPAVIGHHERYDGNGYPRRIAGEDIPASARILCIADSFDAMTSKRCYKELMPVEKALRIIREEEGKQFDPDMAEVFIHIFREGKIHLAEPAELKREEKA